MNYRSNLIALALIFLFGALIFCKKTNGKVGDDDTCPTADSTRLASPSACSDTTRSVEKWALLIGIDKYKYQGTSGFSNLAGCVNDAMDMKNLLIGKFGFKEDHIKLLIDEQATHAAIIQAFQDHLIENAQPNDIVVIHYSGHGSQMKDVSGDEPDGWDETIVPHDSRDPEGKVFDMSDDEINGLLQKLNTRTKNVTFVIDACHSGTATRAAVGVRQIPPDLRPPPADQPAYALTTRGAAEGKSGIRRSDLDYALISGCLENESAYEHYAEQKEHGALSYFLVRELNEAGAGVTYQDVIDKVGYKINFHYPNQHPQLEGTKRNNYVFSDSTSIRQSYVLAFPKGSNKVKLEAGTVHGMTEGSIFEIYKPGTTTFEPPNQPIAKVEITKVRNFESEGTIVGTGSIEKASRAIEREHAYPDLKLRTHLLDLNSSPTLQGIKNELSSFAYIELVPEAKNYTLLIREKENKIVIEGPDTTAMTTPVPVDDPNVVSKVIEDVKNWAKWFNILKIENRNSSLQFEIALTPPAGSGTSTSEPETGVIVVKSLEKIGCKISNKSNKNLYFVILDLSSDGSIAPIFPATGASELIAANSSWNKDIEVYVPDGFEKVKDILKVFATSKPINVDIFTQPAIKKGEETTARGLRDEQNPLEEFFSNAARGTTRGGRVVNTGDWTTTEATFVVTR